MPLDDLIVHYLYEDRRLAMMMSTTMNNSGLVNAAISKMVHQVAEAAAAAVFDTHTHTHTHIYIYILYID